MIIAILLPDSGRYVETAVYQSAKRIAEPLGHSVVPFGAQIGADDSQIALLSCLLLQSGAVDRILTGSASGQEMNLVMNRMPGVVCGCAKDRNDACLLGKSHALNALSLPCNPAFSDVGEEPYREILAGFLADTEEKLPDIVAFGKREGLSVSSLEGYGKNGFEEFLQTLVKKEPDYLRKCLAYTEILDYCYENGTSEETLDCLDRIENKSGLYAEEKPVADAVLRIACLQEAFSVCKVESYPEGMLQRVYSFASKTKEENSLVCQTKDVPENVICREDGWRAFRIEGILDFSLIGILSKISSILAAQAIGIFAVSTYNTDYILVKEENYDRARKALDENGYELLDEKKEG